MFRSRASMRFGCVAASVPSGIRVYNFLSPGGNRDWSPRQICANISFCTASVGMIRQSWNLTLE